MILIVIVVVLVVVKIIHEPGCGGLSGAFRSGLAALLSPRVWLLLAGCPAVGRLDQTHKHAVADELVSHRVCEVLSTQALLMHGAGAGVHVACGMSGNITEGASRRGLQRSGLRPG